MNYLVANWKSFKSLDKSLGWLETFKGMGKTDVEVVVCPPFPYLRLMNEKVDEWRLPFSLGVQDISPFPFGAYTGAIAAEMVKDWVKYAIVGHSERRRYFHETHQEVANKVDMCLESEIIPIVCVDEPYATQQVAAIPQKSLKKCLIAYEPLDAIGTGAPDDPEHAKEVIKRIRLKSDNEVPVLYGGSVTSANISEFVNDEVSDGALVGGASMRADEWRMMIEVFRR